MTALPARFDVRGRLGVGSQGEVWLALDRERSAEVAVKRLQVTDPRHVARFKREFRALADHQHPNLVTLYELLQIDDQWLLTMEPVEGRAPEGAAEWRAALRGIVDGLGALHDTGRLHRDLKASNLRMDEAGRVVLLDFGLVGRVGQRGELIGNLDAIAPEQAARGELGPAADYYALGAMLFRALAGRPVFEGRGAQVLAKKVRHDPPSLSTVAPAVASADPALAAFVDAALQRDPAERMRQLEERRRALDLPELSASMVTRFVGREDELRWLDDRLARTRGRAHVRVRGPSAIGKSSLVRRWVDRRADALVLQGRCFELDGTDRRGIDDIVRELVLRVPPADEEEAVDLHRLFPDVIEGSFPSDAIEPAEALARAARALGAMLERGRGDAQSVVLVVDDAQWGDAASGRLLARLEGAPLLLVTIERTDAADGGLLEVLDESAPPEAVLDLGPLDDDAVRALAVARGLEDVDGIVARAEGHPFLAQELVGWQAREGSGLEAMLARRLGELPGGAARMLDVLTIAGRPMERAIVDAACRELGESAGFESTTALFRARLARSVHSSGDVELEAMHDAIRRANWVSIERRGAATRTHAAIDDAMGGLQIDDPEARAYHAEHAGRSERACELYLRGAERAGAAFRHDRAAELYASALRTMGVADTRRLDVLRARAESLGKAGLHEDAAATFAQAMEQHGERNELEALDLARLHAEHLLLAGSMHAGYDALGRCLRSAGLPPPTSRLRVLPSILAQSAWLSLRGMRPTEERPTTARDQFKMDLCYSAGLALTMTDSLTGAQYVLRSARLAASFGDRRRLARSIGLAANYAGTQSWRATARVQSMIAYVERESRALDDPYLWGLVCGARCVERFHLGEYEESLHWAQQIERAFERTGSTRERVSGQIYQLANLATLGHLEELAAERARLLADSRARGDRFGATASVVGHGYFEWICNGDPAEARRALDQALTDWGDVTFQIQHAFAAVGQSRLDLVEGRPQLALDRLAAIRLPLAASLLWRMPFIRVLLRDTAARALLARQPVRGRLRRRDARRIARLAAKIEGERLPCYDPLAALLRGALAWHEGEDGLALARVRAARRRSLDQGMRLWAAAHEQTLAELGAEPRQRTLEIRDPVALGRALSWSPG